MTEVPKSVKQNSYVKWFFVHVLNHKVLFTLNFIGIIAVTYTRTIVPKRIGVITDQIISQEVFDNLLLSIGILLGFYLLSYFLEYATWMIGHQLGSKTEQSMRREFFQNVQNKPLSFHDGIKTGDLEALATNDLRVINTLIAHGSFYFYPFIQSLITLIQIMIYNYIIGLVMLPFLGIYVFFVLRYRKLLIPYSKQSLTKHADVTVSLQESLNSVQVTKAFCAEEFEFNKFKRTVQAFRENRLGEIRIQARFFPLLTLFIAIGLSLVAGTVLIIYGYITPGDLTAILLLLLALIDPTNLIFWATRDMIRGFGASERLFNIISLLGVGRILFS
ncbi:MAG: ABC transporter transmembrane domain-containing protein [Candidatus Thorarchaeota archaeon]